MSPLRVGLVSVLCVSCFNPSGKASESGETEATTSGVDGTETATTVMASASTDVPTSGSMTATATGSVTEGETSEGSGSTSGSVTSTTTMDTSSGSEGSSTGGMGSCGDGMVQEGELCDDGNTNEDDGCFSNCTTSCGNGKREMSEACDDGNFIDGDGCSSKCSRDAAYVFVSSVGYTPNFGGVAGADGECQALADAAGLPGKYQAWLSDEVMAAKERVLPSDLKYVRPDGAPVAKNFEVFTMVGMGKGLSASISVTETKVPLEPSVGCGTLDKVWTGTNVLGESTGMACLNWTSEAPGDMATVGDLDESGPGWTAGCGAPCVASARLYCLEGPL